MKLIHLLIDVFAFVAMVAAIYAAGVLTGYQHSLDECAKTGCEACR